MAKLHQPMTGAQLESELEMTISVVNLSRDVNLLHQEHRATSSMYPCAVLSVWIDSASDLSLVGYPEMVTPEQRPMVRITVGNQQQVTSIKSRTANPTWTESFVFTLVNPDIGGHCVRCL